MAANDLQILIVVDVRPGVSVAELKALLDIDREDRKILRLSDYGAPKLPPPEEPHDVDWTSLGMAVEAVAEEVHRLQKQYEANTTVVYIGGKAPLSTFLHLGYKFSGSVSQVFVLNQAHKSGPWQKFLVGAPATDLSTPRMFDPPRGIPQEPSSSDARLGIFIDTAGRKEDLDPMKALIREQKESVGDFARLSAGEPLHVQPLNIDAIVRDLSQFMSQVTSFWPERRGTALFAAVPTQVAVAIGRAMSANVTGRDVWLTEYRHPRYEFVYSLPFEPQAEPSIPKTAEAVLARRKVLDVVKEAFDELVKDLDVLHVPVGLLRESERAEFVQRVKAMRFEERSIEEQPFQIRVAQNRGCLGAGMLQAMLQMTPEQQRDFTKLVILHEIVHDWQELTSTNHTFIGRAGFVLEEIDYFADVFAVHTLVNLELDLDKRAHREVSKCVLRWIDMVHRGIEAFDRMEQGPRMKHLTERRLRRYLLWYVQHARAQMLRTVEDVPELFNAALTVELAPLAGFIDARRHEKVVKNALEDDTELCISLDGRLVRILKMAGYSIPGIVDAVREYKHEQVTALMFAVVDRNKPILARWQARK
ncbi:MAG: SAVED domain-containing protein [Polyangiaceae bacterium]|nr:SAVED domain-containing protein [Polyangiaceae bacterium]